MNAQSQRWDWCEFDGVEAVVPPKTPDQISNVLAECLGCSGIVETGVGFSTLVGMPWPKEAQ